MENESLLYVIYLISSPVLVLISGIGLYQLRLMKKHSQLNSKEIKLRYRRESLLLAHEKIDFFNNSILPLVNELDKLQQIRPIELLNKSEFRIENKKIIARIYIENKSLEDLIESSELSKIIDLFNKAEYFSSFIFTKIVDEELIFGMLSSSFQNCLEKYVPLIILLKDKDPLEFNNLIKLYIRWNHKLEVLNIERKIDILENEKNKVYEVIEFKALGTD